MYNIAICEDNKEDLDFLQNTVETFCHTESIPHSLTPYTSSVLLSQTLKEQQYYYDLFLLDIELPEISGMTLAKQIRDSQSDAIILFITSHTQYAIEAFDLDIFRYIPKTLLSSKLIPALKDTFSLLALQNEKFYLLQRPCFSCKIPYRQILFIDRDGKNIIFHLSNGLEKERASLHTVYARLSSSDFTFIEHGILINLYHAMRLDKNVLTLSDGTILNVSRSHLANVRNAITQYWGNHL
ncbi:MAG: response regulator transcription factor [Clostridiales bacterium]|nr:response regulator transcription factor [Clostridiales bacterium]